MSSVRLSVVLSEETDRPLRLFLASIGRSKKENLSRFIEESIREHIMDYSISQAQAANKEISEEQIAAAVNEAVQWARTIP